MKFRFMRRRESKVELMWKRKGGIYFIDGFSFSETGKKGGVRK